MPSPFYATYPTVLYIILNIENLIFLVQREIDIFVTSRDLILLHLTACIYFHECPILRLCLFNGDETVLRCFFKNKFFKYQFFLTENEFHNRVELALQREN